MMAAVHYVTSGAGLI